MVSRIDNIVNVPDIGATKRLSEEEVTHLITHYIADIKSVTAPPTRYNDLPEFFRLVQNVVRSREASEKVPISKRLLILSDDPPEEIDTEAITFYLQSRVPGQLNRGSAGSSRVKEVIAHVRSIQQHPEHLSEKLITMGRFYDNWIAFNIYAKNDITALNRVLWFEKVMDSFRWYFRVHGISQIVEEGIGNKEQVEIGGIKLTKYPMSYYIRTEDTYQFSSQELKEIELSVDVSN